jgi:hypothetical protein
LEVCSIHAEPVETFRNFFSNLFSKGISLLVRQSPDGMIRALLCARSPAFPKASLFFTLLETRVWVIPRQFDAILEGLTGSYDCAGYATLVPRLSGKTVVDHEESGLGPGFLCMAFVNTTLVLSPFRARAASAGNPESRG